jgi:hypothetical protein
VSFKLRHVAIISNCTFDNWLTYHDLTGWRLRADSCHSLICSFGALANIGNAAAPAVVVCGIAGALMSSVWNCAVTSAGAVNLHFVDLVLCTPVVRTSQKRRNPRPKPNDPGAYGQIAFARHQPPALENESLLASVPTHRGRHQR